MSLSLAKLAPILAIRLAPTPATILGENVELGDDPGEIATNQFYIGQIATVELGEDCDEHVIGQASKIRDERILKKRVFCTRVTGRTLIDKNCSKKNKKLAFSKMR